MSNNEARANFRDHILACNARSHSGWFTSEGVKMDCSERRKGI